MERNYDDYIYVDSEYMKCVYESIAVNLRKEREKQGLSVIDLEKISGIDRSAIYKMESNKRRFGLENLIKICFALKIKLSDLYKDL